METQGTLGIGVGVMILNKEGQVLLGRRMYTDGEVWSMPGGKLEFGETLLSAAIREAKEECNLDVSDLQQISVSEGHHKVRNIQFVTIGYVTTQFNGELKNNEPETFFEWQWFSLDAIPENIFSPSQSVIDDYLKNKSL